MVRVGDRWFTGLVTKTRPKSMRPVNGCAYVLKRSEVQRLLPGIGRVDCWSHPIGGRRDGIYIAFSVNWTPGPGARPRFTMIAVPSEESERVRGWFESVVWPEAQSYVKDVKRRKPDAEESKTWWWNAQTGETYPYPESH